MKISIVTVTYNCEKEIAGLIACIERLKGNEFEWVVIDGGSTDSTVALVSNARVAHLTVRSEPDFGIYDALNKAVRACQGEYYLVLGADDRIYDDTLQNFTNELNAGDCDFVAAAVKGGEHILFPGTGKYWRRGGNAFVASHAVGTLIKTGPIFNFKEAQDDQVRLFCGWRVRLRGRLQRRPGHQRDGCFPDFARPG
jgi:glycosyltransferase involved in cell wall biosynthesis